MHRFSSLLCGGLLLVALASFAHPQAPASVTPELFKNADDARAALPRLMNDLKANDDNVRARAVVTLGAMGPIAKPAAATLVEVAVNNRGHAEALKALAKIDDDAIRAALRRLLVGGTRRCKCGISFSDVVASAGEPMVPHLIFLLDDKNVGTNAELTLVQIGEPAVSHLVNTFDRTCKTVPHPAVLRALTQLGPKAKAATLPLERQIDVSPTLHNVRIAQALIAINGAHPDGFDIIHDALKAKDRGLQTEALSALVQLQAKSPELIPATMKLLTGGETSQQQSAMTIMMNIGAPAVPPLIETLNKIDTKQNLYVMYTLSNLGLTAADAVPSFVTVLNGNDADRATLAAQNLPRFGLAAKRAVPDLRAALKSDNLTLRRISAQSLVQIDREQITHTVAPLVEIVRSTNVNERNQAIWLLHSFGPNAKSAVPALLEVLNTQKLDVRMAAVQALIAIDANQVDNVMPTLLEALADRKIHGGVQGQAVFVVSRLGPKAKIAAPAVKDVLRHALRGESFVGVNQIIMCLKKIDAAAEIMPVVIDALNSAKAEEREEAHYVVLDFLRDGALAPLEAAIANGQLRESAEVTRLMKDLRPKVGGAGQ